MAEFGTAEMKDYLKPRQGQDVSIDQIRSDNNIGRDTKAWKAVPNILFQLEEQKIVKYKSRGVYRVVKQVVPVKVFGVDRKERPPFPLDCPRDLDTNLPMDFWNNVVIREGDLITVGGVKSAGKTQIALNFAAENIDAHPVLMGNEYTVVTQMGDEPAARFLKRVRAMDISNADNGGWVSWAKEDGSDKFTLLPVDNDYAEHVIRDRINIIDWIDLDGSRLFDIGHLLREIKKAVGKGVAIVFLQKGQERTDARGGQFVRDYSDLELTLDSFGKTEVLLTIRGCKEMTAPILGKTYAYNLSFKDSGTQIHHFREVKPCPACKGTGYSKQQKCEMCWGLKMIDL